MTSEFTDRMKGLDHYLLEQRFVVQRTRSFVEPARCDDVILLGLVLQTTTLPRPRATILVNVTPFEGSAAGSPRDSRG